jgi:hypothetical protein
MDISGDWYNELGSKMTLIINGAIITGAYQTAVGDASGIYDLTGRVSVPSDTNYTLGFVVTWQNKVRSTDAVTSWAGEAREIGGEQFILTTWLLSIETAPADDWKSTLVGKDTFTRYAPNPATIEKLKAVRGPSHHLKA